MVSGRIPATGEPNAWARALAARRAAGAVLFDLTETNPTRTGLAGDAAAMATVAAGARYEPDPRGLVEAREAVAAYHAAPGLDADHVVLTTGTSESYAHVFRLLADPGETVLAPAPSYPLFEPIAALEGVRLEPWRLAWDGDWHADRAAIADGLARGARAVIVVQPNHPTGSCLTTGEIAWLEAACAEAGAAIVADEVFHDFGWEGALPGLAGRDRALTFTLSGLSKVCGLPQLKTGWIAVSGPAAARQRALEGLEWIADLFLSVATPVQHALPRLLAARGDYQQRVHARVRRNLAALDRWAAAWDSVDRLRAQGGWTAVVRLPVLDSDEHRALALLDAGVVLHPGHFYDFAGDGHVVVSLIVEPDVLDAALERWSALLAR